MIMPDISIGPMSSADWEAVAAIYQEGIDTGLATFEVSPPASWDGWQRSKIDDCSLVARNTYGVGDGRHSVRSQADAATPGWQR